MAKMCILDETKICNGCGSCDMCDLNPEKVCDNCGKCIETDTDYNIIDIDEIVFGDE